MNNSSIGNYTISDPYSAKPLKTNLKNLNNLEYSEEKLKQLGFIKDIVLYVLKNKELNQNDIVSLKKLSTHFTNEIKAIYRDTRGIRGFFNFIFKHKGYVEDQERLKYLEVLSQFAESIDDKQISPKKMTPQIKQIAVEATKTVQLKNQVQELTKQLEEKEKELAETKSLLREAQQMRIPEELAQINSAPTLLELPSPTPLLPSPSNSPITSVVPPPPPPNFSGVPIGMPPPPPPVTQESAEQKYDRIQKEKLQRALNERANPTTKFYIEAPISQAESKPLEEKKKTIESNISRLEGYIETATPNQIERFRKDKASDEKALAEINENLKPRLRPADSKTVKEKLKAYTTEELKFMIGILLDDYHSNEEGNPITAIYNQSKDFLDDISREWNSTLKSKAGIFLKHQSEWIKFGKSHLNSIISLIQQRQTHPEQEPSYKPIPFSERKLESKPIATQTQQKKPEAQLVFSQEEIIAKLAGLAKKVLTKPIQDLEETPNESANPLYLLKMRTRTHKLKF